MTRLAVIMSVYKQDNLEHLKEALLSLYNQSFSDFDIFIQCDGILQDEMILFLKKQLNEKKINFLGIRDNNLGLAASLNELLEVVFDRDYQIIIRMDSDDICEKERIMQQYNFLIQNSEIDVVGSDIIEFFDDGVRREVNYPTDHDGIFKNFAHRTAIPHVTAMFRRSFFEKSGFYNIDSNRNEDQWLWLDGFKKECRFASISKPLVNVRLSKKLLSRRVNFKHNLDTFYLRNKVINDLGFPKYFLIYNFLIFVLKLLPPAILQLIYKIR